MSKELEETKYGFNVYARQLNKDLTNLMELLRKQDKDNKAILYAGRHIKKVILPYEEYQKMCQRLDAIDKLQEEVGCPLEAREKAFDKGFYDIDGNHYFCEHYVPYLKAMHTRGIMDGTSKSFKLKDYKKTWFLKQDKSE